MNMLSEFPENESKEEAHCRACITKPRIIQAHLDNPDIFW